MKKSLEEENKDVPAYFLSLSLENIKCFKGLNSLKLSDENGKPFPWTIILGNNGVGKTTLLQCLANMAPFKSPLDFKIKYNEKTFDFELKSEIFKRLRKDLKLSTIISNKKDRGIISCKIVYGSKISENKSPMQSFFNLELEKNSIKTAALEEHFKYHYPLIYYGYGASRRMSSSTLIEKTSTDTTESLFSDDAVLKNPEEWFLQMDYFASKESDLKDKAIIQRDKVKDILINLLPDVKDIVFKTPTEELKNPQVMFVTPYGEVPLKELSLGYKSMITWVVDLASRLFERYKNSENPIAEPAVVLIDELDLHLHPSWQRNIISFLTNNFINTQFIVTAHSPLIVQSAPNANIVLLRKEEDHVVIDDKVSSIRNWRVDQILTSDLFGLESSRAKEYDDLLEERKKLLTKKKLTKKDKNRIKEIEDQVPLPVGENKEQIEAMDLILRAAKSLKEKGVL